MPPVLTPTNAIEVTLLAGHSYRWTIFASARTNESDVSETRYFQLAVTPIRPVITSVVPDPVSSEDDKQALLVNGHEFLPGCSVTLRDKRTGQQFTAVRIAFRRISQIVFIADFTKAEAPWTIEVLNPGGFSSGEFRFDVIAPKRLSLWRWRHSAWPWAWGGLITITLTTAFCGAGWWWSARRRFPRELAEAVSRVCQAERDRLIRDLHDRTSADVAYFAQLTDRMLHQAPVLPPEPQNQLRQLAFAARDAETAIGDLIWAADPQNESLRQLAARLRERIRERLEPHGIKADFQGWPAPVPDLAMSTAISSQALYLCHEVLNNVIKHAEATNLFCTLFVEGGSLVLRFRDDGRGFQIDDQPKGRRGLANIRARVQRLRGSVEMRSAPNEGTELAIRLPLGD